MDFLCLHKKIVSDNVGIAISFFTDGNGISGKLIYIVPLTDHNLKLYLSTFSLLVFKIYPSYKLEIIL